MENNQLYILAQLVLPKEVLSYFDVKDIDVVGNNLKPPKNFFETAAKLGIFFYPQNFFAIFLFCTHFFFVFLDLTL